MSSSGSLASWRWVTDLGESALAARSDDLVDLLGHADWRARRAAAMALARAGRAAAITARLIDAVMGDDMGARNAAIEALRWIGPDAADALTARLVAAVGPSRRFLLEALMESVSEGLAERVIPLVGDADPNVAHAAVELLGVVPGVRSAQALTRALSGSDPVSALAAMQAFEVRIDEAPWATIAQCLRDDMLARTAVRVLCAGADLQAAARVGEALADPRLAVRYEAVLRLAQRLGARGQDAFFDAAMARAQTLSTLVCEALSEVTVRSREREVLTSAATLLGALGAHARVFAALEHNGAHDASVAEDALDLMAAADLGALLSAAIAHGGAAVQAALARATVIEDPGQRAEVVRAAWQAIDAGAPSATWAIVARYGDADDRAKVLARIDELLAADGAEGRARTLSVLVARAVEVQGALVERVRASERGMELAEFLVARSVEVQADILAEALTHADAAVRARALSVVRSDARWAVEAIAGALRDPEARVRAMAVSALAQRGEAGVAAAQAALYDNDPSVVLTALSALDDRVSLEALGGLTSHAAPEVAVEALARLAERAPAFARVIAARLLGHPVWSVRLEAVRALDVRDEATERALEARLAVEDDPWVQSALQTALFAREV